MADNPSNFDISQYYPDDTQDPFDGINFTTDIDPDFEVRLGNDVVSPSIPDIPVSASPDEESSALIASMPSHEPGFEVMSQQPQFVNPREIYANLQPVNELYLQQPQLTGEQFSYSNEAYPEQPLLVNSQQTYIAPQPPYAPYNPAHVNNTNTDWPLAQQQTLNNMLIQDPVFDAPPLGSHQVYTQYPIPDSRTNNQIMMHQQPMRPDYQVVWPAQEPLIAHVPEGPQPMPQPAPQLAPQPAPQLALPALSKPVSPEQVPKGPLPQGEFKPINPNADSYLPRMRDGRYSKRLPTAGTLTTCPPIKRVARTDNGELLLNEMIPRKTHGNKGPSHVEPERYYGPSPTRPEDWGPKDKRGKYLFTYTAKGELAAGLFLSAATCGDTSSVRAVRMSSRAPRACPVSRQRRKRRPRYSVQEVICTGHRIEIER
ncbi:hypothetical protein NUW58_g8431 [Xylaria curta]|uniref:Uncharacterized protein n=1 Tax=Xylaria curta TaxID=42375 RepID=A0ACC1N8H8_9PEZI|nr:hypothetical protein NUW58_g8431 [Xylaria curta]